MIQKKYLCKDIASAESAVSEIGKIVSETPHKAMLLAVYEKGFSKEEIEGLIAKIKEAGIPETSVAGVTVSLVAELMPEGTGLLMNLVLADKSDIEVVAIPCMPGEEDEAAAKLRARLGAHDNVRAVELFGSNMKLNTTGFIEKSMEGHEEAVLFGTYTLRNMFQKVSVADGEQSVEVEQTGPGQQGDDFIFADRVLLDGFVAVVFSGEELKVQANYALGWKPIGRKFSLELGDRPDRGETMIKRIKDMPAVDIYREYLGVYPDPYFISNICEFPLMVERDGIDICLIPIDCGKDGELYFMMTVREGEELRFSFASHDEVLEAARKSLESMEEFGPESLFLTLCGNRINFLKEDAHYEWDGFAKHSPNYALMHGGCELFYHKGRGGILNSAHLAVGLRESDVPAGAGNISHPTTESLRHGRTLPLSDRMSAFLEKITAELLDMAEEATDANNAKSAFLSHMSHEIRTPINAVLGLDEMIIRESSEQTIKDYADDIRSAGNNLLGIINDILDFSKIEAGKMSILPVEYSPVTMTKDLYNVVRIRAVEKGLNVNIDTDPDIPAKLFGDETRIRQVITNLLTNAVKYTEKGSVTLKVKCVGEGTDEDRKILESLFEGGFGDVPVKKTMRIRVSVKDTGIGIRKEDMDALFDEYERFDEKRNRRIEGTGLGLSITKQLLELMGSRLSVDSTYGEGSEFSFEIIQGFTGEERMGSLDDSIKDTDAKNEQTGFTAEDARILVVDDTPVNLIVVKGLLKDSKIQIDTAPSGEDALKLVRENTYDIIFLDQLMPAMNGQETLNRMNEMPDNKSAGAPVIALTANAMANAREEYLKKGFRDYLSKPFLPGDLNAMLRKHLPPEKVHSS